jgi:hypothetical protein
VQGLTITDPVQGAALSHWFNLSQERQESRRGRLAVASPFIPGFVWLVLVLLLLPVLAFQSLFADPLASTRGQIAAMGAMTATLMPGIVLVWVLDRP